MRFVQILLFILILGLAIIGQTNKGGISGTVKDSTGAVVPNAKVTITSVGRNQSITLTTSSEGVFSAKTLEPVEYNVLAEAPNFKKVVVQNIKVNTATVETVNIVLEIGDFSETVNVQAEDVLINTESGTTAQTISEMQLRELPLNNRSVLDLAVTLPNVSGDSGSEEASVTSDQPVPGYNLSLNGGRPGGTAILTDGVNNTGVGIARAVVSFTPETVQEFTVQTSAYSAEYGNTSGGLINITTKPGTNDFRGTALWYHRNPVTNAQPYRIGTTPRTPNNYRYNQVSFTVGGPVYLPALGEGVPMLYDGHNRTFFFFAYEPRWRNDFVTVTTLLPTAAERAGDFRGLRRTNSGWLPIAVADQFGLSTPAGPSAIYQQYTLGPNGQLVPIVRPTGFQYCQFGATPATVPGMTTNPAGQPVCPNGSAVVDSLNVLPQNFIDPTSRKILEFMPVGGNYFLDNGVVRNYIINREVTQNETRYTLRLDHKITKSNSINFRYTKTPAIAIRDFASDVNGSTGVFSDAKQYLISDDHIFSSSLINNLRLSYTQGVFSEDFAPQFSINGGRNLATELGLPSLTQGGLPLFQISLDGASSYNAFADVGSSGSTNNYNKEERYNVDDIVYLNHGNMSWKFGVNISLSKLNVIPFFGASGGRWEFRTLNTDPSRANNVSAGGNSLASLLVGVPNQIQVRPLLLDYNYYWKGGAAFVQNDWKVLPNLTVNLGFRYALQYPRGERNDQQGVFRPDLSQTVPLTPANQAAIITGLGITPASPNYAQIVAQIPSSIQIPVFALAGMGGRSHYLVPVDYKAFEPRFGFAWSPKFWKWAEDRGAVVRGGYGISHAPLTGNNRLPNPDFGGFQPVSTVLTTGTTPTAACPILPTPCASNGTADASQPVRLTGNPPSLPRLTFQQALASTFGLTPDGLITLNSLGVPGFAFPGPDSGAVPYTQNWNVSLSMELFKNTVVEVAYVGNKGTHLFMPFVNLNPRNVDFVELLEGSNVPAENTFADPLGRKNALGAVLQIQRNSITSPYFGFNTLNKFFDSSANSIYHGAYVDVRRRFANGLSFTANYTYGKSIDDASDSSPDVRVLTTGTTLGQVFYGAPRSGDRAVSAFDLKHNFNSTFVWDLPFGHKRWLLTNAPGWLDAFVGGWSVSGIFRLQGGQPYTPFITDTNRLGGTNRSVRMDIVPGVPLKNPRYSSSCSVGGGCEPYVNPAAFMRPVKGQLGNAPRTLSLRAPIQQYFDFSIQKTFPMPFIGGEGKRRINFRVDFLNAFNNPVFRYNNTGNTPFGFGTFPSEVAPSQAEVTAWNSFAPGRAATVAGVTAVLNSARLPTGALPLDFFHLRIPEGFATTNANSFDITTVEGLRLYRLRQTYDTNFGTLFAVNNPRYIQFGIRLFF
jgi:hypothetical protein